MQNTSLAQIKLKANEFIQDYERQMTEKQYQKQKMKQNIMLQIMSNRHKTQTSQSNSQQSMPIDSIPTLNKQKIRQTGPISEQRNLNGSKYVQNQFIRSNSVPNAIYPNQSEQQIQPVAAQITFKGGKGAELLNMQRKKNQKYYQSKNSNKEDQVEQVQQIEDMDNNQTLRQNNIKSINMSNQIYSKQNKCQKIKQLNNYKPERSFNQKNTQLYEDKHDQDQEVQQVQQSFHPGPIFLTMQQNQSMDISQQQKKKNLAFDIVMDKSQPIDDIDQLRRKKIQQMQKKRLLRKQEFKKQQQQKRNTIEEKDTKRPTSALRNSNRVSGHQNARTSEDIDSERSKSKSQKKRNPDKQSKTNLSSQNIVQQSHYAMKPPQQPHKNSYLVPLDKERNQNYSRTQYNQTPKTISSENRIDKSKGKNTIFRQSPKRQQKSVGKYIQQPKIQPKQRKNTFSKQSNKKLMITALSNVCLPGELNRKQRQKLIEVIEKQPSQFFVFLFKEYSRKVIKAIYVLDSTQSFLQKIYGEKAPQQITSENVQSFYRFDSGSREFKKLDGCKSFSLVVHAIDLA